MPIFKVTMTEQTTSTYVAYVDASSEQAADDWASMIPFGAGVGNCISEETHDGSVEEIEQVDDVPVGYSVGTCW